MHRRINSVFHLGLLTVMLAGLLFPPQSSVYAAPVITVTPITWNVIGLDSNDPLTSGPENFPIGARVCNTSPTDAATGVNATFDWGDPDTYDLFSNDANPHPYINLRPATNSEVNVGTLAANTCTDAYFEVKVNRSPLAYEKTRRYHIDVTSTLPGGTVTTSTPRELFVEHLISQSRNYVYDIKLGPGYSGTGTSVPPGGTMTLMVGQTYDITVNGKTATQGYNQLGEFINFPNTIFQVLDVNTTYSADNSPAVLPPFENTTMLYGDACKWDNDPGSPTYRSCIGGDYKNGGSVDITYTVMILSVPSSPPALVNPQPLSTLVYDFSGSSYHYNADFGISMRYAYIVGPSSVTIDKSFTPKTTAPNDTSLMTIKLTNPTPETFTSVNFSDVFPSSSLKVGGTPGATYVGCGSGTLSSTTPGLTPLTGGESSVYFLGGILAPNSTCTITLNVTAIAAGTYPNTTGHLYINTSMDTGNTGADTLIASSSPAPPSSCVGSEVTLATWEFPATGQGSGGGGTTPDWTTKPPTDITGATAQSSGAFAISSTRSVTAPNSWLGTAWSQTAYDSAAPVTPPATSTPYYDFTLNYEAGKYGGIFVTFQYYLENADWGNSTNNAVFAYAKPDSGSFSPATTINPAAKGSWQSASYAPAAGSVGTTATTFRISATGAQNATARMYLDSIVFMGCANTTPNPPTISKGFAPTSIKQSETSMLFFTITNPNASTVLSGVAFTDELPTGLSVADSLSIAATCTPAAGSSLTLTTSAATGTLSVTGGTLAGGASCTVSVPVVGTSAGQYLNVSGNITSTQSGPNTGTNGYATAPLDVVAPPGITKKFGATTIFTGASTSLTFTVTNPNLATALNGITFTDNLPSGLIVSNPNGLSGTCGGGTITATPGSSTISLGSPSMAALAANSSCTFSVNVTGTSVLPGNTKVNMTTNITSTEGGDGNVATASLVVNDLNPSIELTKQISTAGSAGPWYSFVSVNAGSNVWYRFSAYNGGDVPFTAINVSDPVLVTVAASLNPATNCDWSAYLPLLPGATAYCVLGPTAAVAGSHINTASVTGTHASGITPPISSSATYGTPALTLVKSVAQTSFTSVGETLNYDYLVTNSGFAPLPGSVTVTDDKAIVSCPAVSTVGDNDNYFDPGEDLTCVASYLVTADDVVAGYVTNTASALVGGITSNTASQTVSKIPDFTVSKTNDVSGSVAQNGIFKWTLTVSNISSGSGAFADAQTILSDTLPGIAAYYPQGALTVTAGATAPTGTISCSITGTALACSASGKVEFPAGALFHVTFAVTPTTAGSLENTATVDPNGSNSELDETNNSGTDTVVVTAVFDAQPTKSIVTTSEPSTGFILATERVAIGEMIRYRLVSRIPEGSFTNVQLLDGLPNGLEFKNDNTVTVALVCNGGADCMTSSTLSGGGLVVDGASGNISPMFAMPGSAISAVPFGTGTNITFSLGNIDNAAVIDLDSEYVVVEFNALVLNVNSSATINQGTNNQTGENIANNRQNDVTLFVNGAMTGTASPNVTVSIAEPAITSITKAVTPSGGPYLPGDALTYTLSFQNTAFNTATNTVNTNAATAFDVVLTDSFDANLTLGTINVSSDQGAFCAGGTAFASSNSTVGQVVTVNVSCLDPMKTVTVTINATIAGNTSSGTVIGNSYVLSYTSLPGEQGNCSSSPFTCTGVGTSGSAAGERGGTGGAGADGTVLNNYAAASNTVSATVAYGSITIIQDAVPNHAQDFAYTGTGPGGYDFGGGFSLDDDDTDGALPNSSVFISLAPGAYTVTQGSIAGWSLTGLLCTDSDGGSSVDLGTGAATIDLDGGENITCTYTNAQLATSIFLTKTASLDDTVIAPAGIVNAGDSITYAFSVENTGNVTVTNITVADPLLPGLTCTIASLAPGATSSCAATENVYILTQADVNAGSRANTATATGKDPDGNDVSDPDNQITPLTQVPSLAIVKNVTESSYSAAGAMLHYSYLVTNTGNVTVDGPFTVTDDKSTDESCPVTVSLIPGASITCSATYTVISSDITNGSVTNVASAHGSFAAKPVESATDTETVPATQIPSLAIVKSVTETSYSNVGDVLHYSYLVTNTGNVTLDGPFTVTDDKSTDESCPVTATLAPGASILCAATFTVAQVDLDSGSVTNIASAHGAFGGNPVHSATDTVTINAAQTASLIITKSSDATGSNAVGDTITYTYNVENTGNVTLTNVTVTDDHAGLSAINCTPLQGSSLLPGGTMSCTATYTVVQADVDAGKIDNTGVVVGTPPTGSNVTDSEPLSEPVAKTPLLGIVKEVSTSTNGPWNDTSITVMVDDTVYYRIRVSNLGNVTLTGLTVDDGMAGCALVRGLDSTGNNDNVFEVGEEWVYTCSVTAVLGTHNNTATADTSETPSDSDTASYIASAALVVDPAISKAGNPTDASVGETVTFTLVVTNQGTAPAPDVVITDVLPSMFNVTSVNVSGAPFGTLVSVTPPIGTGTAPYTVVVTLGSDLGVTDVVTIQIVTTVNDLGTSPINNTASLTTSASTDVVSNNADSVTIRLLNSGAGSGSLLPATGFAPNMTTVLEAQPTTLKYEATDLMLDIPSLGVNIPIVGVPKKNGTWNISWLGDQAGWLEGSAFPSWSGNSVLTSHVYLSNGMPGPFIDLNKMKYDDQIIVYAYGHKYTFAVQTNTVVEPTDSSVMKHEEKSWLTLVTCKEYDEKTGTYRKRVVVRAVLVRVDW